MVMMMEWGEEGASHHGGLVINLLFPCDNQENYIGNFVQSTLNALQETPGGSALVKGGTLVVSGDGRFYNLEAIQTIIKIAAANGVGRFELHVPDTERRVAL